MREKNVEAPSVLLFVTCLVDLFRPSVGFAAVKLLQAAGHDVRISRALPCCGQPAYNAGDADGARRIARQVIAVCEGHDYIVLPSGSCAAMLGVHYPRLFKDDERWRARSAAVAGRSYELTAFLAEQCPGLRIESRYDGRVTYHDSCSGLRELNVKQQPRRLLAQVAGLSLAEHEQAEVCCGFGGMFCMKYDEIADQLAARKAAAIQSSQAVLVLAGELGCLLHIAGKLHRNGSRTQARHIAEVLAGDTATPAICQGINQEIHQDKNHAS